jgi:glycerol-3-phosphate dehydrogenase (NAD(P)+)
MIGIIGTGAFGTALAVTLAQGGRDILLWGRDKTQVNLLRSSRENAAHLPGVTFPENVTVTAEIEDLSACQALLFCIPMQTLGGFLAAHPTIRTGVPLVACCKGIDLKTLRGPVSLIAAARPEAPAAILTGPSFATDIARGLPTALTLACTESNGPELQELLSTPTLRLYRTDDVIGAELGGALKNVIAIAAGVVVGAGLGDSARAALMTRGYAEMVRLAHHLGARPETLGGLSGFGDLVLTCTSAQSRNFRFGLALGQAKPFDPAVTVEGVATAGAVTKLAAKQGLEMPVTAMVAALVAGEITLQEAIPALMTRPLKQE